MKRETKFLFDRALSSLILSIEFFNRPWERGRKEAVIIFLDHSFEMLLKAIIIQRGGQIRQTSDEHTIGLGSCITKCLTNKKVKCLTDDQALTIRLINGFRDAAVHYILEISEDELYVHAQAGVTLFGDLIKNTFNKSLNEYIPERVLPISTKPPTDFIYMMDEQFKNIASLLSPKSRKKIDAVMKIRPIAIMENAVKGIYSPPTEKEIVKSLERIAGGEHWANIYPGVAQLRLNTEGHGLDFNIRITKHGEIPVRIVAEGESGIAIAVKKVNELSYYSLGLKNMAEKLGIGSNKLLALVHHLGLQNDDKYYRQFKIGKQTYKRYSEQGLALLRNELRTLDIEEFWKAKGKEMLIPKKAKKWDLIISSKEEKLGMPVINNQTSCRKVRKNKGKKLKMTNINIHREGGKPT